MADCGKAPLASTRSGNSCVCFFVLVSFVSVGTKALTQCHPADLSSFHLKSHLPCFPRNNSVTIETSLNPCHTCWMHSSHKPGMPFHKPCSSVQLWWWHIQDSLEMAMQRQRSAWAKTSDYHLQIGAIWTHGKVSFTPTDPIGTDGCKFLFLRGSSSCKSNPGVCTDSSAQVYKGERHRRSYLGSGI